TAPANRLARRYCFMVFLRSGGPRDARPSGWSVFMVVARISPKMRAVLLGAQWAPRHQFHHKNLSWT
ncbi:MAG: hypothetical protein KBG46_06055, partial [Paracoccus sp.]|nr:hypothetical protein [Paracoccus sp. (in: a-proteobacteria)]